MGALLFESELKWSHLKMFGNLGSSCTFTEFCFTGRCDNDWLELGFAGNGTTSKSEHKTNDRSVSLNDVSMSRVHKACNFKSSMPKKGWKRVINSWCAQENGFPELFCVQQCLLQNLADP